MNLIFYSCLVYLQGKIDSVGTFNELGENQLRHFSHDANEETKEVKIEKFVKKERMHSVASFQSVVSLTRNGKINKII